jgi:hypothetical protein
VGEHGAVATGEEGGHRPPAGRQRGVADRVHAAVDRQQPFRAQPVVDRPATDAQRDELRPRHRAALAPGERGDAMAVRPDNVTDVRGGRGSVTLTTSCVVNVADPRRPGPWVTLSGRHRRRR